MLTDDQLKQALPDALIDPKTKTKSLRKKRKHIDQFIKDAVNGRKKLIGKDLKVDNNAIVEEESLNEISSSSIETSLTCSEEVNDVLLADDSEQTQGISEHSNEYWDIDCALTASNLINKNRKMYKKDFYDWKNPADNNAVGKSTDSEIVIEDLKDAPTEFDVFQDIKNSYRRTVTKLVEQ